VSGRAELGKIGGDLLQIFDFEKVLNPDDVHRNDGPPTAKDVRSEKARQTSVLQNCNQNDDACGFTCQALSPDRHHRFWFFQQH
jgi:hypothetical protein